MSCRPTLALLIPAYNAAAYLPRLFESARRQTEPFDEIWVYDDCSTDDTAAVAAQFGASVVRSDVNRGCTVAKNILAKKTNADWLHFHDADDELKPTFVALALKWMQRAGIDVVLFPYEERDDSTGAYIATRYFDGAELKDDPRAYAIRVQINPFCGLYRNASFMRAGGYDEDPLVHYNEDVAMHIQLAFSGLAFAADVDVAIINHRRLDSMSASNRLKCEQAQFEVMRKTAAREGAKRYAADIANRLWLIAAVLAAELDWKTADDAATLAVKLAGTSAMPPGHLFASLCRLSPPVAMRVREGLIRLLKPQLRINYPGWRMRLEWQDRPNKKKRPVL